MIILLILLCFATDILADNTRPNWAITTTNNIWSVTGDRAHIYWGETPFWLTGSPQPGRILMASRSDPHPTVLVEDTRYAVRVIRAANDFICWTESAISWTDKGSDGAVKMMRVIPTNGPVVTIVANTNWGTFANLPALAIDEHYVYFVVSTTNQGRPYYEMNGGIYRAPYDPISNTAGNVELLAGSTNGPLSLAVDQESVYWAESVCCWNARIMKVPKGGGTSVALWTGASEVHTMAVDNEYVYYAFWNGGIERVSKNGGPSQIVLDEKDQACFACGALSVDSTYVYYGNMGSYNHFFARVSKEGGEPELLVVDSESAPHPLQPWDSYVDQTGIYFSHCPTGYPASGTVFGYIAGLSIAITNRQAMVTITNPYSMFSVQASESTPSTNWIEVSNLRNAGRMVNVFTQSLGENVQMFFRSILKSQ